MENSALETRIRLLEKKLMCLSGVCVLLLVGFGSLALTSFSGRVKAAEKAEILHVRGLVIEDAQGRARILIGAPFPGSKDRVRQDSTTEAMLFLDDHGHDRLTVGEGFTPQVQGKVPQNFHRVGSTFGIMLHNTEGDERGGFNWLSIGRGAITLDRPTTEALGAFVDDKTGRAGMVFNYPSEVAEDASAISITTKGTKGSISLNDVKEKSQSSWAIDNGHVTASGMLQENNH